MTPSMNLTHRMEAFTGRTLTPLALQWEDSANWLWKSEGRAPELIKLARTCPERDPFWQGLWKLFGFDRWKVAATLPHLAGMLPSSLSFIPLSLKFLGYLNNAPSWSLPWCAHRIHCQSMPFAELLGDHIGRLHREAIAEWGHPLTGSYALDQWPHKVRDYLAHSPQSAQLGSLVDTLPSIPTRAVWCLPDLRADQFLNGETGWFWSDWEALLWAPIEFDWSLLELLLDTPAMQQVFYRTYRHHASPPVLSGHRLHCRAILWTMHVFGDVEWKTLRERPGWVDTIV